MTISTMLAERIPAICKDEKILIAKSVPRPAPGPRLGVAGPVPMPGRPSQ